MKTQTATTDFTNYQLVNYNTNILEAAKKTCSAKMMFHQSEINLGYTSTPYHFEQMAYWKAEFIKWVPIVNAAKARDKKEEADFYSLCV